jgi:hypothetical protein
MYSNMIGCVVKLLASKEANSIVFSVIKYDVLIDMLQKVSRLVQTFLSVLKFDQLVSASA